MTSDPNLDDKAKTLQQLDANGYDPEARDRAWAAYFNDPANGWPENYPEEERKAIEEHGGG